MQLSRSEQACEYQREQACLSAAGVAAAVHATVHVVAVQRVKAHAAARRRQVAHLPDQAIHRILHRQHTPVITRQCHSCDGFHTPSKGWQKCIHMLFCVHSQKCDPKRPSARMKA